VAEVVLFHHVLGLTDGVIALADDLRQAGHLVHTPDLFEGLQFGSIDDGATHVEALGIPRVIERGVGAVEELSTPLAFCGLSLGVLPAQCLAQTRPGAVGCVALEAFVPPDEFGDGWPRDVALQVHGMADDPFFAGEGDLDVARSAVEEIGDGARGELFVYPGNRHLFVDRSLDAHDADAAGQVLDRVLQFLDRIDAKD
jgi:dienelactone hydrolase